MYRCQSHSRYSFELILCPLYTLLTLINLLYRYFDQSRLSSPLVGTALALAELKLDTFFLHPIVHSFASHLRLPIHHFIHFVNFESFIMAGDKRNPTASEKIPPLVRHLVSERALKAIDVVRINQLSYSCHAISFTDPKSIARTIRRR